LSPPPPSYGMRSSASGSCATDANVDVFATSGEHAVITIADGSWPRLAAVPRVDAPTDTALCMHRGAAKVRVNAAATYRTVGATGDPAVLSPYAAPGALSKPRWLMAGVKMPLATELATGNTQGNEEYILSTDLSGSVDSCVQGALSARASGEPDRPSPFMTRGAVAALRGGAADPAEMAFEVPAAADVAATRTLRLCARVNLGTEFGVTPWIATALSVLQHPRLKRYPATVAALATANVDRTGLVTFAGVLPDDEVAYSERLGAEGECHASSRSERQPIGQKREATFTRVDGEALQFSNTTDGTASYLCLTRTGDTRSYLLSTDPSTTMTTRTTLTLGAFPTALYATDPRDIPITSGVLYNGDAVGLATSSLGCAKSTNVKYAPVETTFGLSALVKGYEFGTASSAPAGGGKLCVRRAEALTPVEYAQSVRVARVEATYDGVSGNAANRAIKVNHYLSFYAHGDSTRDIWFRGTNIGTEDQVSFALKGKCRDLAVGTHPKTTVDGQNRLISKNDVTGKFSPADRGGVFELCYRACDDVACALPQDAWVGTAYTLVVVRVSAVFPGQIVRSTGAAPLYVTGEGIGTGDQAYLSVAGPCSANRGASAPPSSTPPVTVFDSVGRVAAAFGTTAATTTPPSTPILELPVSSTDFSQTATYNKLCYVPQNVAQHSSSAYATFALPVQTVATVGAANVPVVAAANLGAGQVRVFVGQPATITLEAAAGQQTALAVTAKVGVAAASAGGSAAADCAAAGTAGAISAAVAKSTTVLGAFTATVTAPASAGTARLCVARPTETGALAQGLVAVTASGVSPLVLPVGSAATHTITFTNPVNLSPLDTVCLVVSGSAAPLKCDPGVAGSLSYALSTASTFQIPDPHLSAVAATAGSFDVYLQPGGTLPTPAARPVRVAGDAGRLTTFAVALVPGKVIGGTAGGGGTVYLGPGAVVGDAVFFVKSTAAACAGAAEGAKTIGTARTATVAITDTGTYFPCIRAAAAHVSGSSMLDTEFVRLINAPLSVVAGPEVTLTSDSRRVQVGAPAELIVTGTVQANDDFRVLVTGKTCVSQSTTVDDTLPTNGDPDAIVAGKVQVSWEKKGFFAIRLPASSENSTHAVCYKPAAPASVSSTWVALQGSPTFTAVKVRPETLTPRAAVAQTVTDFAVTVLNGRDGDLIALVPVTAPGEGPAKCQAWAHRTEVSVRIAINSRALFSTALPAGTYGICYLATDTAAWRWHGESASATVRIVGIAGVDTRLASAEVNVTYSLRAAAGAAFVSGDRISIVEAGTGSCAPPSPAPAYYRGLVNVSAVATAGAGHPDPSVSIATLADYPLPGLITGRQYRFCAELVGAAAGIGAQRLSASLASVVSYRVPWLGYLTPASVRPGTANRVRFHGSLLDGKDVFTLARRNSTSATSTAAVCGSHAAVNSTLAGNATNGLTVAVPSAATRGTIVDAAGKVVPPTAAEAAATAALGPGLVVPSPGLYDVCYYAAGPNATGLAGGSGVVLQAVDLAAIAPTGSPPTAGIAQVKVTFTGLFDAGAAADFVALIPTKDAAGAPVANCSTVNRAADLRAVVLDSATTGHAMINATLVADEYALCFHFGGVTYPYGNAGGSSSSSSDAGYVAPSAAVNGVVPPGLATGKVSGIALRDADGPLPELPLELLPASKFVFAVRLATSFAPLRIANGTAQEIVVQGSGVRAGDQVVLIPSSAPATVAECVRAAATISAISVVYVRDRDATFKRGSVNITAPAGTFRMCYRFSAPEVPADAWTIVSGASTLAATGVAAAGILTSSAAAVESLRTVTLGADARASVYNAQGAAITSVDASLVVLQGSGLSWAGDEVRFVNASRFVPAASPGTTSNTGNGSSTTPAASVAPSSSSSAPLTAAERASICATTVAGAGVASVWLPVRAVPSSQFGNAVALENPGGMPSMGSIVAVTVRPGDLVAGNYTVCYRHTIPGHQGIVAAAAEQQQLRVVDVTRVLGSYPRRLDALNSTAASSASTARIDFYVLGTGLSAAQDKMALTSDPNCGAVFASAIAVAGTEKVPFPGGTFTNIRPLLAGVAAGTTLRLCYYPGGDAARVIDVADALAIGPECGGKPPACPPSARFRCGCTCQATPCATTTLTLANSCSPRLPGFVYCDASALCARTPGQCPAVGECAGGFRCPQGGCGTDRDSCAVLPACPAGMPRCLDGSCGTGGRCVDVAGNPLTEPQCAVGVRACPAGTCAAADGSCPHFDGCPPVSPVRCASCSCAATEAACPAPVLPAGTAACTSTDFPVQCADGSCAASHAACSCARFDKFGTQTIGMSSGVVATARRTSGARMYADSDAEPMVHPVIDSTFTSTPTMTSTSSSASTSTSTSTTSTTSTRSTSTGSAARPQRRFMPGAARPSYVAESRRQRFELRANEAAEVWVSSTVVVYVPANFVAGDGCDLEIAPLSDSQILAATEAAGGTWQPVSAPVRLSFVTRGNISHPRGPCAVASNTTAVSIHWRTDDTPAAVAPSCAAVAVPSTLAATFNVSYANDTSASASVRVPGARECTLRASGSGGGLTGGAGSGSALGPMFTMDVVGVLATGQLPPPPPSPTPVPSPFPSLTPEPYPSRKPSSTPTPSSGPEVISAASTVAGSAAGSAWSLVTAALLAMAILL
jgi:hypothetical protein